MVPDRFRLDPRRFRSCRATCRVRGSGEAAAAARTGSPRRSRRAITRSQGARGNNTGHRRGPGLRRPHATAATCLANGTSPVYGSNDSPPWHFRGLTGALSASPGSTPGSTRTDPRGSHGGGGGGMNVGGQAVSNPNNPWSPGRGASNRRPSWSSPSSSLSVSMHEGANHRGGSTHGGGMGAAIGSAVGTPFGTPSLGRQSGGGGGVPAGEILVVVRRFARFRRRRLVVVRERHGAPPLAARLDRGRTRATRYAPRRRTGVAGDRRERRVRPRRRV